MFIPKLTQHVLDTLDPLLVVRGGSEEALLAGRRWLEARGLLAAAPLYGRISEKRPEPTVTLYKGTRSLEIAVAPALATPATVATVSSGAEVGAAKLTLRAPPSLPPPEAEDYLGFFKDYDVDYDEAARRFGYINARQLARTKQGTVLYVREDCIFCCHMKPLVGGSGLLLFDTGRSDFPPQTPVIRAVPQLVRFHPPKAPGLPKFTATPIETVAELYAALAPLFPVIQSRKHYLDELDVVLKVLASQARKYADQLLPDNMPAAEKLSWIDQRLDFEIIVRSGLTDSTDRHLELLKMIAWEYAAST